MDQGFLTIFNTMPGGSSCSSSSRNEVVGRTPPFTLFGVLRIAGITCPWSASLMRCLVSWTSPEQIWPTTERLTWSPRNNWRAMLEGKASMLPGCFATYRNIIFGSPSCTSIFLKTRPIGSLQKSLVMTKPLSNRPWITRLYILVGLGMRSLPLTPHPRLLLVLTFPSIKARLRRQIGQLQHPGWFSWNGNLGIPTQHLSWNLLLNVLWMAFISCLVATRLSP